MKRLCEPTECRNVHAMILANFFDISNVFKIKLKSRSICSLWMKGDNNVVEFHIYNTSYQEWRGVGTPNLKSVSRPKSSTAVARPQLRGYSDQCIPIHAPRVVSKRLAWFGWTWRRCRLKSVSDDVHCAPMAHAPWEPTSQATHHHQTSSRETDEATISKCHTRTPMAT